jgi:hypothetical protein
VICSRTKALLESNTRQSRAQGTNKHLDEQPATSTYGKCRSKQARLVSAIVLGQNVDQTKTNVPRNSGGDRGDFDRV